MYGVGKDIHTRLTVYFQVLVVRFYKLIQRFLSGVYDLFIVMAPHVHR